MSKSVQNGEPERIDSQQLKHTIITPHMEQIISPGKNLIYCSTFQIAWNELQDKLIKEEIRLKGDPLMAELLNKQLSTKSDLSEDGYTAMADKFTPEFVERLHKALKEKFGKEAPPKLKVNIPESLKPFLAYAYLYKNLEFPTEFESLPLPMIFRSGGEETGVEGFGISGDASGEQSVRLHKQVLVIDGPTSPFDYFKFKDEDKDDDDPATKLLKRIKSKRDSTDSARSRKYIDIILQLKCKSEDDEMILALIKPEDSLMGTIEEVMERVRNSEPYAMGERDRLSIPKLDFSINHSFKELTGCYFENKGWEDWFIGMALQWIRFRLTEKGALLKSEAKIMAIRGIPHSYAFNKPFLIYLRHKDAKYPYFAMWVDNAELMLKAE
jgi:hypothetical protein